MILRNLFSESVYVDQDIATIEQFAELWDGVCTENASAKWRTQGVRRKEGYPEPGIFKSTLCLRSLYRNMESITLIRFSTVTSF